MIVLAVLMAFAGSAASAQTTATCKAQAAEKKLAGAALTSFTKKCENGQAPTRPTTQAKPAPRSTAQAARR